MKGLTAVAAILAAVVLQSGAQAQRLDDLLKSSGRDLVVEAGRRAISQGIDRDRKAKVTRTVAELNKDQRDVPIRGQVVEIVIDSSGNVPADEREIRSRFASLLTTQEIDARAARTVDELDQVSDRRSRLRQNEETTKTDVPERGTARVAKYRMRVYLHSTSSSEDLNLWLGGFFRGRSFDLGTEIAYCSAVVKFEDLESETDIASYAVIGRNSTANRIRLENVALFNQLGINSSRNSNGRQEDLAYEDMIRQTGEILRVKSYRAKARVAQDPKPADKAVDKTEPKKGEITIIDIDP